MCSWAILARFEREILEPGEKEIMVDRYTKVVLTIIAAALVIIAAQGAVGQSKAQRELVKVQICDTLSCAEVLPGSRARPPALVVMPAQ
jgi:hypothetical protein